MEKTNLETNESQQANDQVSNQINQIQMNKIDDQLPSAWDLLEESWQVFVDRWETFVGLVAIMFSFPILIILIPIVFKKYYPDIGLTVLAFISPLFLLLLLLSSWSLISLVCASANPNLEIKESLKQGWRKLISYWWILSLQGIIIAGGYLLFIVPGIIFYVWFSLASYVFVVEDIRGMDALLKSKEYIKGYWGNVFWRILFLATVAYLIDLLINLPFLIIKQLPLNLLPALVNLIIIPVSIIYIYQIYSHLREIKKDLVF
ncbi:MAG TPA: hypothetical protein ENL06_01275, partial [Candidatus Portnoybacteria bacterium]|nr:hypothetical protein [Candidatus Portnoybacteria bacterium]